MDNRQILSEIIVQILGFLAVFWMLKKLAWGHLLGVIDARRKNIEETLADLERRKQGLAALEKDYRAKLENIEQEARVKIQEAAQIGQNLARDIQTQARTEAQRLVDRAKADIEQDLAKARIVLRDDVVEISSTLAEKVLKEKLDTATQKRLVDDFIRQIEKV
ncbi:MAG: ATP synthase subunit b, sodium ion specific [Candidatus Omnitrophica bacterium]|nr:ATP synthase subunit b, sodium ion specific [Candidatus Omnitrophota bacterium]